MLALSRPTVIADSQWAFDEGREIKWKDGREYRVKGRGKTHEKTAFVIPLQR